MDQALQRPITIAIVAMGGEGGGVLEEWIVDVGEHSGYIAQMTSVPVRCATPGTEVICAT